jgi:N-acetyl-gamma-glutamyl-phosphate reductase
MAGLLPRGALLHCFSITGYTGGGKEMIAEYENKSRTAGDGLHIPRQYALGQAHKHLPEMAAIAGLGAPPVFCPVVADFPRGMEVTIPLHRAQLAAAPGEVLACYQAAYRAAAAVRVTPEPPALAACNDCLYITVAGNDERLLLIARLDNLGKGASGAAVQCLNLAIGAPETEGLRI